ncbi:MAG: hypothetical protein ACTS6A_02875 [Candidatus Hodgkinia cicadicola]
MRSARRMMACTFDAQCRSIAESHINVNENETCGQQVSENGERSWIKGKRIGTKLGKT